MHGKELAALLAQGTPPAPPRGALKKHPLVAAWLEQIQGQGLSTPQARRLLAQLLDPPHDQT